MNIDENDDSKPATPDFAGAEQVKSPQKRGDQASRTSKGTFAPGASGNPRGRTKGSRSEVSQLAQEAILARAPELIQKAIETALSSKGCPPVLLGLLRTFTSGMRDRAGGAMPFKLEEPTSVAHAQQLLAKITAAVGAQELDPDAARVMTQSLSLWMESHTKSDLATKLTEIERRLDMQDQSNRMRVVR